MGNHFKGERTSHSATGDCSSTITHGEDVGELPWSLCGEEAKTDDNVCGYNGYLHGLRRAVPTCTFSDLRSAGFESPRAVFPFAILPPIYSDTSKRLSAGPENNSITVR